MFSFYATIIYLFATIFVSTQGYSFIWAINLSTTHVLQNATCNHGKGELVQIGLISTENIFYPKIEYCVNAFKQVYWVKRTFIKTLSCNANPVVTFDELKNILYNFDDFAGSFFSRLEIALATPGCDDTELEKLYTDAVRNEVNIVATLEENWKLLDEVVRLVINKYIDMGPVKVINGVFRFVSGDGLGVDYYPNYIYKIVSFVSERVVYVAINGHEEEKFVCNEKPDCVSFSNEKSTIYCCELDANLLEQIGLEMKDLD